PEWARISHKQLVEGAGEGEWGSLVELWWKLEARSRFLGLTRRHLAKGCPEEVALWIQNARKPGRVSITNASAFGKAWWAWWSELNPKWRARGENGSLERAGSGDWTGLARMGPNGMLCILICLRWWRDMLVEPVAEGEMEAWMDAVKDVHWAVQ
ncbi:hypothetical protein C8J57DRAFT_1012743, partial [Mycena rebaudengoi]